MKAVIFDMDGLMIDSERLVLDCIVEAGNEFGLKNIREVCLKVIGTNDEGTRTIFFNEYGQDLEYDNLRKRSHQIFESKIKDNGYSAKKGLMECLEHLKKSGYLLSVATSTKKEIALQNLKSINVVDYFDKMVFGDMVKRSKPFPDIFLKAAELLSVDPKECYVLEDSYNGIKAAHAAGMKPIMVPDLLPFNDDIKPFVYKKCDSLLDVIDIITP